jgi:hypothetical protein
MQPNEIEILDRAQSVPRAVAPVQLLDAATGVVGAFKAELLPMNPNLIAVSDFAVSTVFRHHTCASTAITLALHFEGKAAKIAVHATRRNHHRIQ